MALLQSFFMMYRHSATEARNAAAELVAGVRDGVPVQQHMSKLAMAKGEAEAATAAIVAEAAAEAGAEATATASATAATGAASDGPDEIDDDDLEDAAERPTYPLRHPGTAAQRRAKAAAAGTRRRTSDAEARRGASGVS